MTIPIESKPYTIKFSCGKCKSGIRDNWKYCAFCGEQIDWPKVEDHE